MSDDDPGSAEFSIFEDSKQSSDRHRHSLYTTIQDLAWRGYLYTVGFGEASDLPLAYLMATTQARSGLSEKIEVKIESVENITFSDSTNEQGDHTRSVDKTFHSHALMYSRVEEIYIGDYGQVFVLLSLPRERRSAVLNEAPLGERGMVGIGIGAEVRQEGGATVEARTVAMWSARLDLSLAFWARVQGLRHDETVEGEAPVAFSSQATKIDTRVIPAYLIETPTFQDLGNGVVEARVRLRQELAGLGSVSEFDSLLSEGSINLWFTLESSADEHRS